ncbi:hypothetical protein [Corynebacterium cystitidis]|uniref:glucose-6-phosphate 1-epimerase n=1 Tax=Corynebacterium cystitidis DSM 20524 TaxID=1121357 RepID=A0A1H9SU46_9CORY|nr:hypothetical protein [Corynebacterium cystitidis]WJY83186.1 Putative glucose-6-phosphate 1-epimerase [Corynebacterium cystitidis DSM 20524]SER88374.1 glucose-6-phosphate 1-epimerase [Corynebacterium cystitidis DSM 20524]SNV67247.1 putative aldose 1-epimerase [Corynebacterium cystitidis]
MRILDFGAHVLSAPTSTGDLFFVSSATALDGSAPVRGGLPIIAPWFAKFLGEKQHGWARSSVWEMDGTTGTLNDDHLALRFSATPVGDEANADGWRFELSCTNTGDTVREIQLAFHPYFAVSAVEDVVVDGIDGVNVWDRVDHDKAVHRGDFTFSGLTDRIALAAPQVTVRDANRRLTISAEGTDSTVLWNPGAEAGARIDDLGEGEWDKFVCVEPALLGDNAEGVLLPGGETATIVMTVTAAAN